MKDARDCLCKLKFLLERLGLLQEHTLKLSAGDAVILNCANGVTAALRQVHALIS